MSVRSSLFFMLHFSTACFFSDVAATLFNSLLLFWSCCYTLQQPATFLTFILHFSTVCYLSDVAATLYNSLLLFWRCCYNLQQPASFLTLLLHFSTACFFSDVAATIYNSLLLFWRCCYTFQQPATFMIVDVTYTLLLIALTFNGTVLQYATKPTLHVQHIGLSAFWLQWN